MTTTTTTIEETTTTTTAEDEEVWSLLEELTANEFIDGPRLSDGVYRYRVKSINTVGRVSDPSNEKTFVVTTAPEPPSNITFELTEDFSNVKITWTRSLAPNMSHYNLYCSRGKDKLNISSDNDIIATINHDHSTTYTYSYDLPSVDGKYIFLVRAEDIFGNEEANIKESFMIMYDAEQEKFGFKPSVPYNVNAEALEDGYAEVSWSYNPDLEEGESDIGAAYFARIYYRSVDITTTTTSEELGYDGYWDELMRRPTTESEYSSRHQLVDILEVEDGTYEFEVYLRIYAEDGGGLYSEEGVWHSVEFDVSTPDAPTLDGNIK